MLTKTLYICIMAYLSDHKRVLFMRESTSGVADGQTTASRFESEKSV